MSTKGGQKSGAEAKASNGGKSTAPTNAWARSLLPKRNAGRNMGPPPGMGNIKPSALPLQSKSSSSASTSASVSVSASVLLQHRDRLMNLGLTLIGHRVVLEQTNGAIVEGIFYVFTPHKSLPPNQINRFVLKEAVIQQQPETEPKMKDGITLIVPAHKVVCVHAKNVAALLAGRNANQNGGSNANGTGGSFATDTQISGNANGRSQELVAAGNAWTSGGAGNGSGSGNGNGGHRSQGLGNMPKVTNSRAAALAGEGKGNSANNANNQGAASATSGNMAGSIGQWDQFKANKELFNVNATFDENLYTTQLDTSQIDAKKRAEAERIAKEIENTTTTNIHIAEERGFKVETDFDEEDLYSGVLTKDGKQRHEGKVTISKKSAANKEESKSKSKSTATESSKPAVPTTSASPPASTAPKARVLMNYAAAAAKADAAKNKTAPPGFSESSNASAAGTAAGTATPAPTEDETEKKEEKPEESPKPVATVTPEKEATKATKQPTTKVEKLAPPNDEEEKTETNQPEAKEEPATKNDEAATKEKASTATGSEGDKKEKDAEETKDKKEEKKEVKKSSKLNANAKSFTFNPSAKTFTPSFGGGGTTTSAPAPQHPAQHAATDPNMQMYPGGHPMQPPHYMQAPMGQGAMIPMMNPQYPGMRFPSYMDHHMPQMQHTASHVQQTQVTSSAPSSGNAPAPTTGGGGGNTNTGNANNNEEDSARAPREGEDASANQKQQGGGGQQQQPPQRSQQQQPDQPPQPQGPPQQQQQQQQQISMYPPNAYFATMPPRGPGYPQYVAAPQQIGGRPGVPPYPMYPMQPGGVPPNMQMRGPNGAPYYAAPNGHMPFPPGAHIGYGHMMDDGGRGRGGRGSNGGRGGRGRGGRMGRGGRGRSNNYNNPNHNHNAGGKNTQQQQQHYNHHQSQQQQQQQQPPPQQQVQSGNNESSNKSD